MRNYFFFNDPATTAISTLSLHDALPIFGSLARHFWFRSVYAALTDSVPAKLRRQLTKPEIVLRDARSEEHTSELQSQSNLVCRLLLEKKNKKQNEIQKDIARIQSTTSAY